MESPLIGALPFDRDTIARNFRAHREGRRDEAVRLWTLFNLAAWHDHWIAERGAGAAVKIRDGATAS